MIYPWEVCPCDWHNQMKKEFLKCLEIKDLKNNKKKIITR